MAAKKGIAKKETGAMAMVDERPDYLKDGERGNEAVGMDDLTIPRVDVIQDLSPQHKKNKPEYIEGAEPGMLFNTVTNNLYEGEVIFVPTFFRKEWVIWKDQAKGGGFKGAFGSEVEAVEAMNELDDADDCEVVDTAQHFGIIMNGDHSEEVVMSMSKSKMKVSRKLNSMVKLAGGDRFSRGYRLTAVEDQNAAGQDYWNISFHQLGFVSEEVYHQAEKMYESVSSGAKNVNHNPTSSSEGEGEEERDY